MAVDYLELYAKAVQPTEYAAAPTRRGKHGTPGLTGRGGKRSLKGKRTTPSRRPRGITEEIAVAKKAKKSKKTKSGKRRTTAKQRAAAKRNIKKAQAALRRKKAGKSKARKSSKPRKSAARKSGKKKSKARKSSRKSRVNKSVRARATRNGPSHKTDVNVTVRAAAEEARRGRKSPARRASRKGGKSRETMYENPLPLGGVGEFFVGLLAVLGGGISFSLGQRVTATHALMVPKATGDQTAPGNPMDSPDATKMQIYNAESMSLPIWSNMWRLAAAGISILAPMGISAVVKSGAAKSFWQLWSFTAIAMTAVKVGDDAVSKVAGKSTFALRMYAPELASRNRRLQAYPDGKPAATAQITNLPALGLLDNTGNAAVTFAGVRRPAAAGTAAPPPPPPPPARTVAAPDHQHGAIPPANVRLDEARMRHIHGIPGFNPFAPEA